MVLPPLPPASAWQSSAFFPRRIWNLSISDPPKVLRNRTTLSGKWLCDEFVRELGMREGEVLVEVNPGPGLMTRSLLEGGEAEAEHDTWDKWEKTRAEVNEPGLSSKAGAGAADEADLVSAPFTKEAKAMRRIQRYETLAPGGGTDQWPPWDRPPRPAALSTTPTSAPASAGEASRPAIIKPALVVACEPSPLLLQRGYGCDAKARLKQALDHTAFPVMLETSKYVPNLVLSASTAYRWPTLVDVLSDPLVSSHLTASPSSSAAALAPGQTAAMRKWEDPEPNITVVAHIPDSVMGEQMLAQWIGSVVGGEQGRQWIWQWGRVRLAILCGKGLYNRVMARPREPMSCKLSTMTSALFHRRPLPPYHHVLNADKSARRTGPPPPPAHRRWWNHRQYYDPIVEPDEADWMDEAVYPPSTTYNHDFYPSPLSVTKTGSKTLSQPLARPAVLGILLTPRLHSPIIPSQKESWDYVLRNCFVREMQPISDAISNVGFAAHNLVPRIASLGDEWKGDPVPPETPVQDLTFRQWARVVDVFDNWPFRPDNLMIDTSIGDELSREIGVD